MFCQQQKTKTRRNKRVKRVLRRNTSQKPLHLDFERLPASPFACKFKCTVWKRPPTPSVHGDKADSLGSWKKLYSYLWCAVTERQNRITFLRCEEQPFPEVRFPVGHLPQMEEIVLRTECHWESEVPQVHFWTPLCSRIWMKTPQLRHLPQGHPSSRSRIPSSTGAATSKPGTGLNVFYITSFCAFI